MHSWEDVIRRVPLFAAFTEEDFQELIPLVKVKGCIAGDYLFEHGEPSDSFFVISSGAIRIDLPADGKGQARQIVLKQGDFFGEMGVLRCTPRAGDAFVQADSTLLQIMKDDFDELMAVNASLAEHVMHVFMARLEEMRKPPGDMSVQPEERRGSVFTFFSPSGGVGTSLLAANLALKARDFTQKRILLIDGDFQAASLHVMLNTPTQARAGSIARERSIEGADMPKYVQRLHLGLDFMPGPADVEEAVLFTPQICRSLVANAADQYDYVFIDVPSSLNEPNLTFFQESDQIFMVFSPDLVSVHRVRNALAALERAGMAHNRVKLVLNKFKLGADFETNKLEEGFERRIFGRIQFDPETAIASVNEGLPLVKRNPRSTMSVDIARTTRQLLSLPTGGQEEKGESFSLFGLFG